MKTRFFHLAMLLFFLGCTKEEITPREYPRVSTFDAVDITSDGVTFKGEITFSSVEIKDHGFVWSDVLGPLVSTANKISLGTRSGTGQFDAKCDRSLEEGKKYFMRAYAVSDDFVVYGNTIEFISLGGKAPLVKDFFPTIGTWSDSVTIVGENFSDQTRTNIVKFGPHTATVLEASRDTLLVIVPYLLNTESSNVSVTIFGNVANLTSKQFTLKAPVIESISPSEGAPGSLVTLTGKFFNGTSTKVYFNGIEGAIQSGTQSSVTVKAPGSLSLGEVEVKLATGSGSLFHMTSFTVKPPELLLISPTNGGEGDEIKITGKYFSTDKASNIVTFGGREAAVTSATSNELKVIVPQDVNSITADVKVKIGDGETTPAVFNFLAPVVESFTPTSGYGSLVTITGKYFRGGSYNEVFIGDVQLGYVYATSSTKIEGYLYGITNTHTGKVKVRFESQEGISAQDFRMTWAKLPDYPGSDTHPTAALINNSNAYPGFGSNGFDKFWRFNSVTKAWTTMPNFPGQSRFGFATFTAGTRGYIGGGSVNSLPINDWWEYNFTNNTWTQKTDLPMPGWIAGSFTFGSSGYVLTSDPVASSQISHLWKYNHTNDSWSIVSTAPFSLNGEARFFIADNVIYTMVSTQLWKYDLANDQWLLVQPYLELPSVLATIGGTAYGLGYNQDMKKFNSVLNTWTSEPTPLNYNSFPGPSVFFAVNGRGYLLAGHQVLEFEP